MDFDLLVRRYYDVDSEMYDLCLPGSPFSLEDRLLNDLYSCLDDGIPIEDTVCDRDGKPIYSPEEAEWLFMALKEKLEDD